MPNKFTPKEETTYLKGFWHTLKGLAVPQLTSNSLVAFKTESEVRASMRLYTVNII